MSRPLTTALMLLAAGFTGGVPAGDALVDPTRPADWQAAAADAAVDTPAPTFRLQGVFNVGGRHSAMIGGRRVAVGDRVMGAEVLEIDGHRVLIRVDGETVELVSAIPVIKSRAVAEDSIDTRITDKAQGLGK
ncbi:MAG: hypothetical protein QNJ91_03155 [Gammaproteobacteria bacterium]|nr:hypothetical protein [Gammaproteobacteria bacterium]